MSGWKNWVSNVCIVDKRAMPKKTDCTEYFLQVSTAGDMNKKGFIFVALTFCLIMKVSQGRVYRINRKMKRVLSKMIIRIFWKFVQIFCSVVQIISDNVLSLGIYHLLGIWLYMNSLYQFSNRFLHKT